METVSLVMIRGWPAPPLAINCGLCRPAGDDVLSTIFLLFGPFCVCEIFMKKYV